jgi:hypothetical protein
VPRFRSFTSSSSGFVRDVLLALALLAAVEWYLSASLVAFERKGLEAAPVAPSTTAIGANFFALHGGAPESYFAAIAGRLASDVIVFIGDSQGEGTRDGSAPYPQVVAERLAAAGARTSVISAHLGGSNGYEQGVILFSLLRAGVVPRAVIWSHSIFSQRKNEIRSELVPAFRALDERERALAGAVILMAGGSSGPPPHADPAQRLLARAAAGWDALAAHSATVRFFRRPLWDKGEILRRSPLLRLLPARFLSGTARQFDPPAAILQDAARFAGAVSGELSRRGVCVVHFIAPINRGVSPRPFSPRAEATAYPALAAAAAAGGGTLIDLLNAMPPERFGRFEDGSPDAFHLDGPAHAELAARFLAILDGTAPGCPLR